MSYLDVLLGGIKTIQNNGANLAAEPTLNIIGATSITDDPANKRTNVSLGTGITQLSGDVTAGPGSGSVSSTVVKANGASVPAAGSLTTGNVLQVSGASALSYGPVNLAGGSNYISGALPAGNQAPQTLGGDLSGTTAAGLVRLASTASHIDLGGTVAGTGSIRAANNTTIIKARNSPNNQDLSLVTLNATDQLILGDTANLGFTLIYGGASGSSLAVSSTYSQMNGSTTTYISAPSLHMTDVAVADAVVWTFNASGATSAIAGSGVTSFTVGTNKSAATLVLQADTATTMQTLSSTGTEFAKAITIDQQTAPSAPASTKMTTYVDSVDGKLKAIGPNGTITTLAVP